MSFPQIRHCLLCEDLRVELGNKAAIGGFYGVAPDVEINVFDFQKPFGQLLFLLMGGAGGGTFKVSSRVVDSSGNVVMEGPATEMQIPEGQKNVSLAFGFRPITFPGPGRYRFLLVVDGKEHYDASFSLQPLPPGTLIPGVTA